MAQNRNKLHKTAGIDSIGSPWSQRECLFVTLFLLLAVVVRIIYLFEYRARIPYWHNVTLDSQFYDLWALRVAQGKGYGPSPFYMAPLYPYFLSIFYKLLGHKLVIVYLLQASLGVLNTFLVYLITRRIFGHLAGLGSMALLILYGPLTYLETKLLTEPLAVTLSLISLLLLMTALSRPSPTRCIFVGMTIGIGAVCRPAALVFAVLIAAWLWGFGPRITSLQAVAGGRRLIVPLMLGVILPIVPVTIRNIVVGHDFAILSTNAGIVFAQGNSKYANGISTPLPGFSGSILYQQQEEMEKAAKALGRPVKPSESSAYWFRVALNDIQEQPGRFISLLGKKVIWTLHNRESPCSYNFYYEASFVPILRLLSLPFPIIFALGVIGYVWARRSSYSPGVDVVGLYVLSILLTLVMFSVSSRYRAPMVPGLAVFAGHALINAWRLLAAREYKTLLAGVLVVGVSLLPSLVRFPTPPISPEAPSNMGLSFLAIGKVDQAITELRKSIEIAPDYAVGHNNLGIALVRQGKLKEAIEHYEKAIQLIPDYPEAHYNLAEVLYRQRRFDEAIAHCRAALSIRPDYAPIHVCLANSLLLKGYLDEAIMEYRKALRLQPDVPDAQHNLKVALEAKRRMGSAGQQDTHSYDSRKQQAISHYNTANGLMRQGKFTEAILEFREAVRLKPDFGQAHNNLAVVLFFTGDYAEAWKEVDLARKYGAEPNPAFIKGLSEKMPR